MTVIPRSPVLKGFELICERLAWRDWTLSDTIDAIHLIRVELSDSMPMDSGAVILGQPVNHLDSYCIAPTGLDPRTGIALIEHNPILHCNPVLIQRLLRNIQNILAKYSLRDLLRILVIATYVKDHFWIFSTPEPATSIVWVGTIYPIAIIK